MSWLPSPLYTRWSALLQEHSNFTNKIRKLLTKAVLERRSSRPASFLRLWNVYQQTILVNIFASELQARTDRHEAGFFLYLRKFILARTWAGGALAAKCLRLPFLFRGAEELPK